MSQAQSVAGDHEREVVHGHGRLLWVKHDVAAHAEGAQPFGEGPDDAQVVGHDLQCSGGTGGVVDDQLVLQLHLVDPCARNRAYAAL